MSRASKERRAAKRVAERAGKQVESPNPYGVVFMTVGKGEVYPVFPHRDPDEFCDCGFCK